MAVLLRVLFAWHFRIDSDEPQHLHVVWGWTHGMLPYRELFDNHAPVFQALCAPLFHLLGERPDILLPMRLAMIPLFAATIWCVWHIASGIFSPRTGAWTAMLAAFFPPFFTTSIEFRPDELWTLVWMLTLTVASSGRVTTWRAFVVGLLLGLAFSVSMKTTLLAAALGLACLGTLWLRMREGESVGWSRVLRNLAASLGGVVVVPALVVIFFMKNGAGEQMLYCVIGHNVLPTATQAGHPFRALFGWLAGLSLTMLGAWFIGRWEKPLAVRMRFTFIFLAAAFFYLTLLCFWPIITAETCLPGYPVGAIVIAPLVLALVGRVRWLPALLVVGEIVVICTLDPPFTDRTADKIGIIADTLKLTDESDYVMDGKGETIYRRRPFYYVLEGLTKRRIELGLIKDNIRERIIATGAPLAITGRMPELGQKFIKQNYIPIAFRLWVLGQIARPGVKAFEVAVPSRYTLVCETGAFAGSLDGIPFEGPRELAAGQHTFQQTGGDGRLALVWAQAVERGYSPFAPIKADYRTKHD
ncbi:MAG: glycosyltransferase family 39 protein [Verrucomicrobia bacterium]|nr:glycosyltransferase family 39 protein [Verrucomicrobiota bacterium]